MPGVKFARAMMVGSAELSNSKNFFQKVDGLERERKIIFFSALRTNVFVNFATHTHTICFGAHPNKKA
jgi:hypothetical protein